jgi:hypothetical protein
MHRRVGSETCLKYFGSFFHGDCFRSSSSLASSNVYRLSATLEGAWVGAADVDSGWEEAGDGFESVEVAMMFDDYEYCIMSCCIMADGKF